jgi:hypothetical protein
MKKLRIAGMQKSRNPKKFPTKIPQEAKNPIN